MTGFDNKHSNVAFNIQRFGPSKVCTFVYALVNTHASIWLLFSDCTTKKQPSDNLITLACVFALVHYIAINMYKALVILHLLGHSISLLVLTSSFINNRLIIPIYVHTWLQLEVSPS